MRHVPMGFTKAAVLSSARARVLQVRDHLRYRMEEFLQDGLKVSCGADEETGAGIVRIQFPNCESGRAAALLKAHDIEAAEIAGWTVFYLTELHSFEDMDYVQGAVTEILYAAT